MAQIHNRTPKLRLYSSSGGYLDVRYGNLGEPFREGAEFNLVADDGNEHSVLLHPAEIRLLIATLRRLMGEIE